MLPRDEKLSEKHESDLEKYTHCHTRNQAQSSFCYGTIQTMLSNFVLFEQYEVKNNKTVLNLETKTWVLQLEQKKIRSC